MRTAGIDWYNLHGAAAASRFDMVNPHDIYGWIIDEITNKTHHVLEIGAGSGRDAFWLATFGHNVIAVEPSHTMLEYAIRHHNHPRIEWKNDSLPLLESIDKSAKFSLIMVNAIWMFLPLGLRKSAFERLVQLLMPNGLIVVSVQLNLEDLSHGKYVVNDEELLLLASQHNLLTEVLETDQDKMGRNITWQHAAFRLKQCKV
jgi:protein-L-isoaspartate O-methyltransferase